MPKILIADDEPETLELLSHALRLGGYEVDGARNGEELLEKIESSSPDLIILDVMMPGMDGWDTIRAINDAGLGEHVLIVMLTATDVPGKKMIGLQEFVFDYITKPFEPDELVSKVRQISDYLH